MQTRLGLDGLQDVGRSRILGWVLCLIFCGWGCASSPEAPSDPSGAGTPGSTAGFHHSVEKGQTLWGIAQAYGVEMALLAKVNGLKDPDHLYVGQRLWIPQEKNHSPQGKKASVPREDRPPKSRSAPSEDGVRGMSPAGGFQWPIRGVVIRRFEVDLKAGKRHQGIDIAAPAGSPIVASSSGQVIFSGEGPGKYGKMVILDHQNGFVTLYAYNRENLVAKDQWVAQGEAIAQVGSREGLPGPALHFEIRKDAMPYDPLRFLPLSDSLPPEPAPRPPEAPPPSDSREAIP